MYEIVKRKKSMGRGYYNLYTTDKTKK